MAHESEDDELKQIFLLIPLCLLFGTILRHICIEFHTYFPYTVLLLLLGIIMAWIDTNNDTDNIIGKSVDLIENMSPELLLGIFIPPLVFESAFGTDYHIISREFNQALILAFIGVILNVIFISLYCYYVFPYGWSMAQSITFSSVISATDPVAVVSLLRELGASKQLATLIEGESMLNDGSAFVLYVISSQFVTDNTSPSTGAIVSQFFILVFGGMLTGIIFGVLISIWIRLVFNDTKIEIVVTVVGCYLCYWFSENIIEASGVLGVVFMGLTFSKYESVITPAIKESLHSYWEVFGYMANTLIFIFSGFIIVTGVFKPVNQINGSDIGYNVLLFVVMHISRFVSIMILYYPLNKCGPYISFKDVIILTWGDLRGVIGLSLGLIISLNNDFSETYQHQVLFHICFTVFFTLFINASTMSCLVNKLGMTKLSKDAIKILKSEMLILENNTHNKIKGMINDDIFNGANWHDVIDALPSYSTILTGKTPKKIKNIKDIDKRVITGIYPKSKYLKMKFAIDQNIVVDSDYDRSDEKSELSEPLMTPINSNYNSIFTTESTDTHSLKLNVNYNSIKSMVNRRMPSLKLQLSGNTFGNKHEIYPQVSQDQLIHRILSILRSLFDDAFEEGLILLLSYNALKHAIMDAIDANDTKVLTNNILKLFNINKCLENMYSHFGHGRIGHFCLLQQLKVAIEAGMIFIETVDKLNARISVVPIMAKNHEVTIILKELSADVELVEQKWLEIQQKYPEVYSSIQTRLALNTIIEYESNEINDMYSNGFLNDNEYTKLYQLCNKTQQRLYYDIFHYFV